MCFSYRVRRPSRDHVRRSRVHFQRQRRVRVGARGLGEVQVRRPRQVRTVTGQHLRPGEGDHVDFRSVPRQHVHRDRSPATTESRPVEVQAGRVRRRQTGVL